MKHSEIITTLGQLRNLANKMRDIEEFACFDGSTEVLTEVGWLRLDTYVELTEFPKVLSYDRGVLQFKPVTKVIRKEHNEGIVRIQNKSLDMYMTPDHKVISYKNGERNVTKAEDVVLDRNSGSRVIVAGVRNKGYQTLSNIDRLLISISADGHYIDKEDVYTFNFTKERKVKRLTKILNSLDIEYTTKDYYRKGSDIAEVYFRVKLPRYIKFEKGLHNIVSLQDVSTKYAREFLREVSLWDGSKYTNSENTMTYNSSIEEEVDFYSAMCVLGNSFSQKTVESNGVYKTGVNLSKNSVTLTGSKEFVEYEGEVFCIQVPDTHCFFARRNKGTPFLTHNCDTETNTLEVLGDNTEFKLVGISISWGEYDNYYIPVGHVFEEEQLELRVVVRYLRPIFEREDVRIIGHNLKFDMHVMKRVGIEIKTTDLFDTMIASWICDENTPNGLEYNTESILKIKQTSFNEVIATVTKEEKKEYGFRPNAKPTFDLVKVKHGGLYALADSYFTWELYLYFMDKLEEEEMHKIYNVVYVPLITNVFRMESRGVTIDEDKLAIMEVEMQEDIEQLMYDMYELAGVEFNPASSQQLAELLFGEDNPEVYKNPNQHILDVTFNFPVESRTPKGAPQSNNRILTHLSKREYQVERKREGVELVNKLLEFKKLNKLKSAFVDGIREQMYADGKVHPSFNIIGTTSGRFSCSKPNVQQIPNADDDDKYQIRELFIGSMNEETGKRNKIISADYRNLEMRVMTHFCVQKNMSIALKGDTSKEIGTLVQKCKPEIALAYNFETNKIEEKNITNYWKNGKSNLYDKPNYFGSEEEWLVINHEGDDSKLVVTPNHKIFTTEGKKSARDLKVGDYLYYNEPKVENDLREMLYGISMGDSRFNTKSREMSMFHSDSQIEYLKWKQDKLGRLVSSHVQKDGEMNIVAIKSNRIIEDIKEDFEVFKNGKHKKIRSSIIDKLSMKSLAIWYLDDGSISRDSRCTREKKGYHVSIARQNLDQDFIDKLNDKFKMKCNLNKTGLSLSGDKALDFLERIAPYCPKSMSYKFPSFLHNKIGTYKWDVNIKDVTEVMITGIKYAEIGDPLFKKSLTQSGYDLEVEDLHNYFANNILVSNSKDELLMKMFNNGDDAHGSTAVNMFELDCHPNEAKDKYPMLRNVGKTINFLLAYGGGASALYETLKEQGMNLDDPQYLQEFNCKKGIEVAQKYIDKYFETYSGVADFLKNQKRFARRNEFVYTVLGRKRRLVNINGNDFGTASYEERLALNQPIQGTAGDIMNCALNRIEGDKYLVEELKCVTIMQVHDELIFECPEENVDEAVKIILHYMENSFGDDKPLNLPFTADYGVGDSYQTAQ